jgi:hypothetical protein
MNSTSLPLKPVPYRVVVNELEPELKLMSAADVHKLASFKSSPTKSEKILKQGSSTEND